jgi:hypothetical protein
MTDPNRTVKHVVLFSFKEETTQEKIDELIAAYRALPGKIDAMKHFEWGPDISVEDLQQGFTHCFITTFENISGRDSYIPHEAHQAYVKVLLPHLEKLLVIDYQPQE